MKNKPFNIPNIIEALKYDYYYNNITINNIAKQLHEAAWTTHINIKYVETLILDTEYKKNQALKDIDNNTINKLKQTFNINNIFIVKTHIDKYSIKYYEYDHFIEKEIEHTLFKNISVKNIQQIILAKENLNKNIKKTNNDYINQINEIINDD